MPDADGSSLHLGLATEGASVLGVLADFNFLHHFPEGGTIAGPVLADDADLLGAFSPVESSGLNRWAESFCQGPGRERGPRGSGWCP